MHIVIIVTVSVTGNVVHCHSLLPSPLPSLSSSPAFTATVIVTVISCYRHLYRHPVSVAVTVAVTITAYLSAVTIIFTITVIVVGAVSRSHPVAITITFAIVAPLDTPSLVFLYCMSVVSRCYCLVKMLRGRMGHECSESILTAIRYLRCCMEQRSGTVIVNRTWKRKWEPKY